MEGAVGGRNGDYYRMPGVLSLIIVPAGMALLSVSKHAESLSRMFLHFYERGRHLVLSPT